MARQRGLRALALASVFTLPALPALAGPEGGSVAVGQASISSSGSQTLIQQQSDRALIDWRSFTVGAGEQVSVSQPGASSLLVNRVGAGSGTRIDGSLTANGQVVIIDQAGIIIGRNARIDAGAFIATTANISNADFAAGRLVFGQPGAAGAAVVNEGTIRVADGGYVALAAAAVDNKGVVQAKMGRIVLAGTESFTLDLQGDGLLRYELPAEMAAQVANSGTLSAQGGSVLVTARAAAGAVAAINVGGLVQATRAEARDGRIFIGGDGADVSLTGQLDASAASGTGGAISVTGESVTLQGATLDASGATGGGSIRIGGDYQGKGDLARAENTSVDAASRIRADATQDGAGGRVILWADGRTDFQGSLSAKGAGQGDGGFAEVSGKDRLDFAGMVDLSAPAGLAGTLLLDPANITISTGPANINGDGVTGDDLTGAGDLNSAGNFPQANSTITAGALQNLLNAGTSVTLAADNAISMNTGIAKSAGGNATLTLRAGGNITLANGANISASAGQLGLDFASSGGSVTILGSMASNGGSISLSGSSIALTGAVTAGQLSLSSTGNISQSAAITASSLVLQNGYASLTNSANSIAAVSGSAYGLSLVTSGALSVGSFSGGASLTAGFLSIASGASLNGRGNAVTLVSDSLDIASTASLSSSGGSLTIRPASTSTSIGLGGGAGTLNLTAAELATIQSGFDQVTIGRSDGTGAVTIGTASIRGDTQIQGGDLSLTGALSLTGGGLTLRSDVMDIAGTINTGLYTTSLTTRSSNRSVELGNGSTGLALSAAEIGRITAGSIAVSASGGLSVTDAAALQTPLAAGRHVSLTASGGMLVLASGLSISSNGGSLSLSGTASSSDLYGVQLSGVQISTGSGSISITGSGPVGTSAISTSGVALTGGTSLATNSGNITITGTSGSGAAQRHYGVDLSGSGTNISTANGAISITGTVRAGAAGSFNTGIRVLDGSLSATGSGTISLAGSAQSGSTNTIGVELHGQSGTSFAITTNGGSVSLTGSSGGSTSHAENIGVMIHSGYRVTAGAGSISITGTGGVGGSGIGNSRTATPDAQVGDANQTGAISLAADRIDLSKLSLRSSGRVTLAPRSNGQALTVSDGTDDGSSLHLTRTELGNVSAGILRLGSTSGGNITLVDNPVTGTLSVLELASAGSVTQSTALDIASLSLLGSGSFTLTNSANSIATLAGNLGSASLVSDQALTIGTVGGVAGLTASGNLTLSAASLTVGQAIAYTGSASGSLRLNSSADLAVTANISASGLGALAITLNADSGNAGAGAIRISNASLSSRGGAIILGGGGDPASAAALGNAATGIGVAIANATLNAGGGNIAIRGQGAAATTHAGTGIGIDLNAASLTTSGSGTISLDGQGGAGNSLSAGLRIGNGSSLSNAGGITLTARHQGTGEGLLFISDGTTATRINGGAGTINLLADKMDLSAGSGTASISGTGQLSIRPLDNATSIGLGGGAGTLNLTNAELALLQAGFTSINIGSTAGTAAVQVGTLSLRDDASISTGSTIQVTGTLSTGMGGDSGSLTLRASALTIAGTGAVNVVAGNVTLSADTMDLSGPVSASGTVTLTTTSTGRDIDLGAAGTGTALQLSDAALDRVTASLLRVETSGSGTIGISAAVGPANSSTLYLLAGGGVSQAAGLTMANLAVTAGGAVTLGHADNALGTVAVSASGHDVSLRDDGGFAIGTVKGINGLNAGSGAVLLTSAGTVTQSQAITGGSLRLLGGGDFILAASGNNITILAGSVGSLDFAHAGALTIGTVNGTAGISASGTVKLTAGGNLTIASGASVSASGAGDALVLAANGSFSNNGGATALSVGGGGRFLVFSTSPLSGDTGGVDALPLYNRLYDFSGRSHATIANSGSRFVYSYAPTLTVTPDSFSHTYSAAIPTLTYMISGLVGNDTLAQAVSGAASLSGGNANAGTYTISAALGTLASDLGYQFRFPSTGTLTINPKALTWAVTNASGTYGTLAGNGAVSLTGLVGEDAVTGTLGTRDSNGAITLSATTRAGSYTQSVTGLTGAAAGNYTLALSGNSSGTLTIAPKALTYSISAASGTYGTLASLGTASLSGLVGSDAVSGTVALSNASLSARLGVGTYAQTVTGLTGVDAGNYSIAASGNSAGNLVIAAKPLTYSVAAASATYGQAIAYGAATLTGVLDGDVVTGTVGMVDGSLSGRLPVGTYDQMVRSLTGTDAANYRIADSGNAYGLLTINQAALTITANTASKVYGDADPSLTYTSSGLLEGDSITGSLIRAGGENTGRYAISQGSVTAGGNYAITYTGAELAITPATLTITASARTKEYGEADPTLTYRVSGLKRDDTTGSVLTGRLSRVAGEDVGRYTIRQGGLTANANYTITYTGAALAITPAPLTVTALATTKVYGDDTPVFAYGVSGLKRGDVTGSVLSGRLTHVGEDAGTHAITQGSLAANTNYTINFTGATLTITPAALTVTANAATRVYGDADPALTYSVSGLKRGDGTAAVLSGALDRATGENVGLYAISQGSLAANANYTLSVSGATLSITPAALAVTADAVSRVYGDADPALTYGVAGLKRGDSAAAVLSGALDRAAGENVGNYAINQGSLTSDANYTLSVSGSTLTITPAALTVTADAVSRVYGDADPALTYGVAGLKRGDSAAAVLSGALVRAAGENAGSYAISQGSLAANANYTLSVDGATLTITPAALNVTANAASRVYGDADPTLTYRVSGLKRGDSAAAVLTGALDRAAGENVGLYAIDQGSLASNGNYTLSVTGSTLSITPAALSVTANAVSRVYGDADPTLSYSASGLKRGDSAAAVLSGALDRAAGENVGRYAIGQGSLTANANYTLSVTGATLSITPAALTVTANAISRVYGDADPALSYSASGLKRGDSAAAVLSGALDRAAGENVGNYAISQGSLTANANYTLSVSGASLRITPAVLTVTATGASRVYGDADPALIYSVSGLKRGDSAAAVLTGALDRAAGENVGLYAIGQGSLTANANYTLSVSGASLRITPAVLNVTADAASRVYGDADPALTYSVAGLKRGDSAAAVLTGALDRAAGENVGFYAIGQGSLTANANYTLSVSGASLRITPAALNVTANAISRVYGDADPALTYSVSGLKRGDSAAAVLTGALDRAAGENVGFYAIGQGSLASNANYTLSVTGATLRITPAALNVTANAVSRVYGDADPALTYSVSGLKRGDSATAVLSGTLTRMAGSNAGTYAITQGGLTSNANYTIRYQGAALTVTPAPLTVAVDNVSRAAGAANPLFTARYQGLVNGDGVASLTGLVFTTSATVDSPAGTYAIKAGGIQGGNYDITYVDGVLTVTGAGSLPAAVANVAPVTTITQLPQTPSVASATAALASVVAPVAGTTGTVTTTNTGVAGNAGSGSGGNPPAASISADAALAATTQVVQSASGSTADEDSKTEEMIPGLLGQQRRLPSEAPEGTPGLEQQFPNLGRVW
ncbi:MBG domain-containing protein [Niveispirillum sp. SYP-B3756]|uniref:MBG domain-containing protein n=1 Tax=Niveispirillum sp. SYP-B3756 TaxID=2662178 RepID=UPI001565737B|nr:MBG domain-containing protein [Niveispirillum sp. SYP-B3756]